MADIHPSIKRAADHYDISPELVDEYQSVFAKCDDWFKATNRHDDEYTLCSVLHRIGLLDKRLTCIHRVGMFRGYRIEFKQSDMAKHYQEQAHG